MTHEEKKVILEVIDELVDMGMDIHSPIIVKLCDLLEEEV